MLIDEADYLCRPGRASRDMLDALRDLYDLARVPVLLVGLPDDELVRLLRPAQDGPLSRFSRRITERIEFRGLHATDAVKVASELCEVEVERALAERLHADAGGNVGRLVVALAEAERWARTNGRDVVTLAEYSS